MTDDPRCVFCDHARSAHAMRTCFGSTDCTCGGFVEAVMPEDDSDPEPTTEDAPRSGG